MNRQAHCTGAGGRNCLLLYHGQLTAGVGVRWEISKLAHNPMRCEIVGDAIVTSKFQSLNGDHLALALVHEIVPLEGTSGSVSCVSPERSEAVPCVKGQDGRY